MWWLLLSCADPDARDTDETKKDADGDGYAAQDDCDDADPLKNPGAAEVCDDVDNDCDGAVDGGDDDIQGIQTWYRDEDGDEYGIAGDTVEQCSEPEGYADNADDCDDSDRGINPGVAWFLDADGDGWGISGETTTGCYLPDGYAAEAGDCDDSDPEVSPGAAEVCDGIDNDCDNDIDADDASVTPFTWYEDLDDDGYGVEAVAVESCDQPEGHVAVHGDCDDEDATINPDASEVCDGRDNDCDSLTDGGDDSVSDASTWYQDLDDDGYGNPDETEQGCNEPSGYTDDASDCDDDDEDVHPDADEVCDEVDNDCDDLVDGDDDSLADGTLYLDQDGDGYGVDGDTLTSCEETEGYAAVAGDCDDEDSSISPDAAERFDGVDSDCDGELDAMVLADAEATLVGERSGDAAGYAIAPAGDIDGDGYADVVVGAPEEDSGGTGGGAAYVVLGPISSATDLSLYRSKFIAEYDGDGVGSAVGGGADVSLDGVDDIVVGAPEAYGDSTDGGAVYVMLGSASGPDEVSTAHVSFLAESNGDEVGCAVGFTGDYDGDGHPEVVMGAKGEDSGGGQAGAVYLGGGDGVGETSLALADKIIGEAAGDYAGTALATGGDVDGDGVLDLLIGAPGEDSGDGQAGATYVVLGPPSTPLDLAYADHKLLGEAASDESGSAVAWGGDLDGDGTVDLVIGAPYEGSGGGDAGAVYVVSGASVSSIDLAYAAAKWTGDDGDLAGAAVAGAGDLDADGFDDLAVGVTGADDSGVNSGAAVLLLGPVDSSGELADGDARFYGNAANDDAGNAVSGVGDVDGDGVDDLMIGVYGDDAGGSGAGRAWLVFGHGF